MSSSKSTIICQHKQQYLQLIIKQKTDALHRHKQQSQVYLALREEEQELLSLSNQPICKPTILKTGEARSSMPDDDFLIAELNGHFQ